MLNRIVLAAGLSASIGMQVATEAQQFRDGWHPDLQQARIASRKSGKPIFLVFRCAT